MRLPGSRVVLAAILAPLLLFFVAMPLGLLFWRSLAEGPTIYVAAVRDPGNRSALWNTLLAGSGAAVVALLVGGPLGAALARLHVRGKVALGVLLVLPIAVPPYVWAMAWIALNRLVLSMTGSKPPTLEIYGLDGVVFVLGISLYPLVLLPTRAALESADPALEEAARIGGAGPVRAFFTGAFPAAAPAAVSGALLAFLGAISAFGVPYLLGMQTSKPALVATTRIYQALAVGNKHDVRSAIALCVLLLVLAAAATMAASRIGKSVAPPAGKARRPAPLDAPGLARAATALAWAFATIAVILPTLAIVLSALTARYGEPPLPGNLTLAQFASVLEKPETRTAIIHSAVLGIGSASVIVAIGLAIAFLRPRESRGIRGAPVAATLARLAESPYAVPGSVLALAFILAFSQEIRLILLERVTLSLHVMGTLWILGLAYVVKYLAFGVRAADNAVRSIDPALEEAARISGAGPGRAFVDVVFPLARPAMVAAWILAFLPAATELTMSVLLVGPRTPVLGTVLFELTSYADPQAASVLACIALALVVAADLVLKRLGREPVPDTGVRP